MRPYPKCSERDWMLSLPGSFLFSAVWQRFGFFGGERMNSANGKRRWGEEGRGGVSSLTTAAAALAVAMNESEGSSAAGRTENDCGGNSACGRISGGGKWPHICEDFTVRTDQIRSFTACTAYMRRYIKSSYRCSSTPLINPCEPTWTFRYL